MKRAPLSGLLGFTVIATGQLVSLVGTAMSGLALSIWAYQETGQVTTLTLIGFFSFAPTVLLSPVAGVWVDRLNRKLTMMLSDLGTGVSTALTLLLFTSGRLELWHLYALAVWVGTFNAFQLPAYAAAITTMVTKQHYGRASGMLALAQAGANVLAPALAGVLLVFIGIPGVLLIDLVTFGAAILGLLLVSVPNPPRVPQGPVKGRFWQDVTYGFRYLGERRVLRHLLALYAAVNLIGAVGMVMLVPLVLARSGDELALGSTLSALGLGGILGGLLMSAWGGPERRVHGVLLGLSAVSLFGYLTLGLGQQPAWWLIGAFSITFFLPLLGGSHQAIWQAKVAPEVQGRVFAARQLVGQIGMPLVMLGAGPLADLFLEPTMMPGGELAGVFGPLVGTGEGSGIALLFVLTGGLGVGVSLGAYLTPSVRGVETQLPDHHAPPAPANSSTQAVVEP